jgi:dTDP-4-amino-4,6-dideoxygalactose transaminase
VRVYATQAREPARHYEHREIGHNERMSNLVAAVVRGQLENLPDKVAHRRAIFTTYRDAFAGIAGITFPATPAGSEPNRWLTVIEVNGEQTRDQVLDALGAEDIEARWRPSLIKPSAASMARPADTGSAVGATMDCDTDGLRDEDGGRRRAPDQRTHPPATSL